MADEESEVPVTVKKVKKAKEAFKDPPVEVVDSDEDDDEEGDDEFEFDMDEMNLGAILQNFLVNEEGQNVCEILTGFKKSVDTQNKILMKIVGTLETKAKTSMNK